MSTNFLDIFRPDKISSIDISSIFRGSSKKLTNKKLLKQLSKHFTDVLVDKSLGSRMLFPMSFVVLMHPEDYDEHKEDFPFVLPEVVAEFYRIIETKSSKHPNHTPPSRYWFFQFSRCSIEMITNQENFFNIRKGKLTTIARLLSSESDYSCTSTESNIQVSVSIEGSKTMPSASLNPNAIKGLEILTEGIYKIPFNESLSKDTNTIKVGSNIPIAELFYTDGSYNYNFMIKSNLVHVSGIKSNVIAMTFLKLKMIISSTLMCK